MTKKNKLILIISICVVIVIAGVATTLWLILRDRWQDAGNNDYTPPPPTPPEPVITYDIILGDGVKDEYYLNEPFDINNVRIYYRVFKDGALESSSVVRCSESFIKGYPEVPAPDTDTLGTQSFTLTYLSLECNVSFDVVEYSEEHVLSLLNENIAMGNESLFVLLKRDLKDEALNYVDSIYDKVIQSDTSAKVLSYLSNVENILTFYNDASEISVFNHPTDTSKVASIEKVGNIYNGTFWVTRLNGVAEVVFELEYYTNTKGLRIEMSVDGVSYSIYVNSTETTYNMVISGAHDEDIILNYGSEYIYLSTCDIGTYDTLYTETYSATFGSIGNKVLSYNISDKTYELN